MKYLKKLNEMADIQKNGNKLSVDGTPLKNMNLEDINENMIYWRNDKGNYIFDEGYTMVWFVKDDATKAALLEKNELLVFFPKASFGFGSAGTGPIHDIWKSKQRLNPAEKQIQKGIIGAIEAHTDPNIIYIEMMSVRKGYMKNGINNLMIKQLIAQFPNAVLKFSNPTKEGLGFIKKYYPNAKIEGIMTDEDIADLLKRLKNDDNNFFYTGRDVEQAIIQLKIPMSPNNFVKPSSYSRECWRVLTDYAKSTA